jgi:hypothetical protein
MIGVFLATLELIRQKKIAVEQLDGDGEVRIRLRDDAGAGVMFEAETAGHGEAVNDEARMTNDESNPNDRLTETGKGAEKGDAGHGGHGDLGVAP